MKIKHNFASTISACILIFSISLVSLSAHANDAGAFIGGVFATKLLSNLSRSADAEERQSYRQPTYTRQPTYIQQPTYVAPRPAPQAAAPQTAEQRLKQLDKLAAGGYITPAEYKQQKQAIINNL